MRSIGGIGTEQRFDHICEHVLLANLISHECGFVYSKSTALHAEGLLASPQDLAA